MRGWCLEGGLMKVEADRTCDDGYNPFDNGRDILQFLVAVPTSLIPLGLISSMLFRF